MTRKLTQEEINKSVVTDDFRHFRYDVVEETDAEPADIKVLLLKSSEGLFFQTA